MNAQHAGGKAPPSFGGLARFEIQGLFGWRDIEFSPHTGGPTLLTGVNGSGKSTILRCINAVGSGQWLDLLAVPFKHLTLEFGTGEMVKVIPEPEEGRTLDIEHGGKTWTLDANSLVFPDPDEMLSRGEARRILVGRWEFEGRIYRQADLREVLAIRDLALAQDAEWVIEISKRFPVLYVPDQRLGPRGPLRNRRPVASARLAGPQVDSTADQYARDLQRVIAEGLSDYATHSQNLDQEFPRRVVAAMASRPEIDVETLGKLLDQVGREREELVEAGLLVSEEHEVPFDSDRLTDEKVAPVIKVYVEQTLKKFEVLVGLKTKLQVFKNFLNSHYRNKLVFITPRGGFSIGVLSNQPGELAELRTILRASELSSGEQQMLVLAYEVIFRTEPHTLILIDEPELSLHVLWQATLIDDLSAMADVGELTFVLATHSPTLIGDREELRVSLDVEEPDTEAGD